MSLPRQKAITQTFGWGYATVSLNTKKIKGLHENDVMRSAWGRSEAEIDACVGVVRYRVPAQPVDATQALNLSAGVSNCKVSRGRSLS